MRSAILATLFSACGGSIATPTSNHTTAPTTTAVSDSTLALLEPVPGGCVLRRRDPVAKSDVELARFPTSCTGARISWRADLRRAFVWFDPDNVHSAGYGATGAPPPGHPDEPGEALTDHRYDVDLETHAVTTITPPANEPAVEMAYGADGSLLAFAEREFPNAKGVVTVEGRVLDFSQIQEGLPAAAITYRLTGSTWRLVSVAKTTTGWDYARGWSASPEAATIGPRSSSLLEAHAATAGISDAATRAVLERIAPSKPDDFSWAQLEHAPVYVWMLNAEFVFTTGRIAWRRADGSIAPLPELGFTGGELVAVTTRGRYLLVDGTSTGSYPRLYDLVDHALVFGSETARAVTFWPKPS